ncbi:MAG: AmmeMemoRadiSam system protein B [Alphaproteobacteria bacterium]|nr:AmmeMemoRadiSam system protein B [Alphaproteobacteria bacterium]
MAANQARPERPAAVAGSFYPADGKALAAALKRLLGAADTGPRAAPPKALIVPHAGYVYSGPVAATAYGAIGGLKGVASRVVVIGPSHFKPFAGIAAPSAAAFATPLGPVAVDRAAIATLLDQGLVVIDDEAHAREHALEVQLPFLVAQLGPFRLVPLLVGDAPEAAVAAALEAVWGGRETLIVVSSDLSHYHSRDTAAELDGATARAIENLAGDALTGEDACGFQAIAGVLAAARRHGLKIERLGLATSADTAGDAVRVVGYGAWALAEE